jgi:hypothetical protein
MQSAKGILPHKIDPVNAVVSKVAEVKQVGQQNELLKGYANMMAFNGEPPKEGEK